jgi:hypothetical protein
LRRGFGHRGRLGGDSGHSILLHHVGDRSEQARTRRQAQTQHRRSPAPRRRHCHRRAEYFGRSLLHRCPIDHGQRIGESAEQRAVAQQVDAPRHATRQLVNAPQSLAIDG